MEYIVDFYCHELRLAIEIDGEIHEYQYLEDAQRQGEIEKYGVTFLIFQNIDIKYNMFSVLLIIEEKIKELIKEQE